MGSLKGLLDAVRLMGDLPGFEVSRTEGRIVVSTSVIKQNAVFSGKDGLFNP